LCAAGAAAGAGCGKKRRPASAGDGADPPPAAGEPLRVVSHAVVADEFLLAVADHRRLAALSHLAAEPDYCADATLAARFSRLPAHTGAEAILRLRPDLVVFAEFSPVELVTQVRRAGAAVHIIGACDTLDETLASLNRLAARLGPAARTCAAAVEADCRRRAAALAERLRGARPVRVFTPSTFEIIPGAGTNFQDFCEHAGADNVAASQGGARGHAPASAERILSWTVDKVVLIGGVSGSPPPPPSAADIERAVRPFLTLPPYRFMSVVRERRVALLAVWQSSCISHHRVACYEYLARQLHPERFKEE